MKRPLVTDDEIMTVLNGQADAAACERVERAVADDPDVAGRYRAWAALLPATHALSGEAERMNQRIAHGVAQRLEAETEIETLEVPGVPGVNDKRLGMAWWRGLALKGLAVRQPSLQWALAGLVLVAFVAGALLVGSHRQRAMDSGMVATAPPVATVVSADMANTASSQAAKPLEVAYINEPKAAGAALAGPTGFGSVREGVAAVADGGTVLLHPGEIREPVRITKPVRLVATANR